MKPAPTPPNEIERLRALEEYEVLDTPPEAAFDAITKLAAHFLQVPIALVSIVDVDRQWFKSRHGLDVPETPREVSFCGHVVATGQPIVVPNATEDERFLDNPLVTAGPRVRFYAGYPLRTPTGFVLGTLCVLDRAERALSEAQAEMLGILAGQVVAQLELRRRGRLLEAARSQLSAVLDSSLEPILTIDEAGVIQSANPATRRLFGYEPGELVGQNVRMLISGPFSSRHDGDFRAYLESGQAKVGGTRVEVFGLKRDGTAFPAELAIGEAKVGSRRLFTGILRDLTQRKLAEDAARQAQAELERSREDLAAALNQIRVGTLILDAEDRILFLNEACLLEQGLESAEAVGRSWEEVIPLDAPSRERLRQVMRQAEPERSRVPLVGQSRAGRRFRLDCDVRDYPGDARRRILYLYDISEVFELKARLDRSTYGQMVGASRAMVDLYQAIRDVSAGDWTVLIEGETGSGKDLVARSIHSASSRKDGPFIAVNCAGLSETLLASQLFGHRRGAFTGAVNDQQGFVEAAAGGTLFLDEIGDLPLPMQSVLLRVLQEKEVVRLGETRPRKVDVRILCATHRDLVEEVKAGRLRQDLIFRIRVARVRVPSLRERLEDLPLLVGAFLAECRVGTGRPVSEISASAMKRLGSYPWPGNVRELKNAVEFAVVRGKGPVVSEEDLPPEILAGWARPPSFGAPDPAGNESRILEALQRAGGYREKAARLLGMSRATFYRRLEELGIGAKHPKRGKQ